MSSIMPRREGYDLFTKAGWKNAYCVKFNRYFRMYVLRDTFGKFLAGNKQLAAKDAEIERLQTPTNTGHCPVCGGYVGGLISSTDEKRQVNDGQR